MGCILSFYQAHWWQDHGPGTAGTEKGKKHKANASEQPRCREMDKVGWRVKKEDGKPFSLNGVSLCRSPEVESILIHPIFALRQSPTSSSATSTPEVPPSSLTWSATLPCEFLKLSERKVVFLSEVVQGYAE